MNNLPLPPIELFMIALSLNGTMKYMQRKLYIIANLWTIFEIHISIVYACRWHMNMTMPTLVALFSNARFIR